MVSSFFFLPVLFLHGSQIEKFEKIQPDLCHQPRVFSFLSDSDDFEKYSELIVKVYLLFLLYLLVILFVT